MVEFRDALHAFLELHVVNLELARGVAPAVFPRDDADPQLIAEAAAVVDLAAGRAAAAPSLTGCVIQVQGLGNIDPIAVWHTITQPKPVLEPSNIISACNQMLGRLEALVAKARAEAPPEIGVKGLHPLIWGAARALWLNQHRRQAVAAGAETLIGQLKARTGRYDVSDTSLWKEAFSADAPSPGKPRLRWPGDPTDRQVKSMNDGLRQFAAGAQLTIRNSAVHSTDDMGEQEALERLAVLSLLARWMDDCVTDEA